MDYSRKNCAVTGGAGFIGSKLSAQLKVAGANVIQLAGDVRDMAGLRAQFSHSIDYVFHFGSPSSQVLFGRNTPYCVDATISGFINLMTMCRRYGSKLIYPSTGLIAQGNYNPYARCKKVLEDMHLNSDLDALGLRIYAAYGPGESHKRDYASVVHLFTRDILNGIRPTIFGDGLQTRDFIYIDDLVRNILILADRCDEKIVEVGSGNPISFNEVVSIIKQETGSSIDPKYIPKPMEYYDDTICDVKVQMRFCPQNETSLCDGIRLTIKSL